MINVRTIITAAALLAFAAPALADDRAPTEAEAAAISSALKAAGFNAWSSIERDDGKWEIDNAAHSDGKTYDVDLRLTDLAVIKKDLED